MTSSDEDAFMAAILASPDDDTPRLVFADWLDERGTEDDRARAALIRAQCRLEYLPAGRERRNLESEVKALLKSNEKRWTAALRAAELEHGALFRRGFLDGLTMSPTTFMQRGEELFRLAPTLRSLRFPNAQSEVTDLAKNPFLARLASVDLTLMCTCGLCPIEAEVRNLFRSKHTGRLKYLNLSRDRVTAAELRVLTRSSALANLTALDLSDNPVQSDGAAALASSKHLGAIVRLNLSRTDLQTAGAEALARAKHFPALTHLELSDNRISTTGVRFLVAAPFFNQLTALDLSKNPFGEVGARALAVAAPTSKLERLDLRGTQLGKKATQLLKTAFGKKVKLE
jgi:uncharacterized protein (TIGR02996 family)